MIRSNLYIVTIYIYLFSIAMFEIFIYICCVYYDKLIMHILFVLFITVIITGFHIFYIIFVCITNYRILFNLIIYNLH